MASDYFWCYLFVLKERSRVRRARGCWEVELDMHEDCFDAECYKFSGGLKEKRM